MNKVNKYLTLFFLVLKIVPPVYAGVTPGEQITIAPPSIIPNVGFSAFLSGLISMLIILAFLAAFIYLIWGGFQWVTSGGDEAGISAARGRIMAALVGLTIVVASWAIFQLVEAFFGVTVFRPGGFRIPVISS